MCACGCFLAALFLLGLGWAAIHGLWLVFVAILLLGAATGWFGGKAAGWRPGPK